MLYSNDRARKSSKTSQDIVQRIIALNGWAAEAALHHHLQPSFVQHRTQSLKRFVDTGADVLVGRLVITAVLRDRQNGRRKRGNFVLSSPPYEKLNSIELRGC